MLAVWVVGSGAFLLMPSLQRFVVKVAVRYFHVPVFVDYTKAKLAPGDFVFVNPLVVFKNGQVVASAETLEIRYSYGNPILIKQLRVIRPRVDIRSAGQKGSSKSGSPDIPNLWVQRLVVVDGRIKIGQQKWEKLSFTGGLKWENLSLSVVIDSAGVSIPGRGDIQKVSGSGIYTGKVVDGDFQIVAGTTKTNIHVKGLNPQKATFENVHLSANPFDFSYVDSLLALGGILDGIADLDVRISRPGHGMTYLSGAVAGTLWGIPVNLKGLSMTFDENANMVKIDKGEGTLWGAYVVRPEVTLDLNTTPLNYKFKFGWVDEFNLAVFGGPRTELCGPVEVEGAGFGDDMKMKIVAEFSKSKFENFVFDGGKIVALLDGLNIQISTDDETSFVCVDEDTIKLMGDIQDEKETRIRAFLSVRDPQTLLSRLGYDSLQISGKIWGRLTFSSRSGVNIDLYGNDLNLYGIVLGRAKLEGKVEDLDNLTGSLRFEGSDGEFLSAGIDRIDTVLVVLHMGKNRFLFHPLKMVTSKGTILATGYLLTGDSLGIRLDGLTYDQISGFSLAEPVYLSLKNGVCAGNIRFTALNSAIEIDTLCYTDSLAIISGKFEGVKLSELTQVFSPPVPFAGVGKGHFDAVINPKTMRGKGVFDLYVAPFKVDKLTFASFSAEAKLSSDTLTLIRCFMRRPGETANVSGFVVLSDSVPYLNLNLAATGKNPGFVSDIVPQISTAGGAYNFQLSIRGARKHQLNGNFFLRDGKFYVEPLDDPVDSVNISVRVHDTLVQINEFSAQISSIPLSDRGIFAKIWRKIFGEKRITGNITARGVINLADFSSPKIDIFGEVNNLPLRSSEEGFYMIVDGTYSLLSPPFHITGDLVVRDGTLLKLGSPSPEPTKFPVDLDIALTIKSMTVLLSSIAGEIEATIGGDILISAVEGNLSLLGEMNIPEGKYFAYGQNFVVKDGKIKFDRTGAIDPEVDITASTTFGQDEVFVHITGRLSAPHVDFYSNNPEFTREDILRLLAGLSDSTMVVDALQQRTRYLLEQYLAHNLEKIARQTLGVDEFSISPTNEQEGYFKPSQLRLTVGKKFGNNLFLRYSQTLSDSAQQSVELEYSLSRHISLQLVQTPEGYYQVRLNFKWSY